MVFQKPHFRSGLTSLMIFFPATSRHPALLPQHNQKTWTFPSFSILPNEEKNPKTQTTFESSCFCFSEWEHMQILSFALLQFQFYFGWFGSFYLQALQTSVAQAKGELWSCPQNVLPWQPPLHSSLPPLPNCIFKVCSYQINPIDSLLLKSYGFSFK